MAVRKKLEIVLIKPSHYDDDGYVIQWFRSPIPSNTLASLYGLARECADNFVLGRDVDIEITAYDESNTVIPIRQIIRKFRKSGHGFVGLLGVQSNQFPRAVDIARPLRAANIPVIIGGFHVSGCMAMLPELPDDIKKAQDLGITLYAGEAEGRFDEILHHTFEGTLKPVYNYMHDLPEMGNASRPFLRTDVIKRTIGSYTSFDAGRGCPFQCSFCTIINVQGRKSRYRTPDDMEAIIRSNDAQGVNRYFVTDDNFARNRNWEAIFDRFIYLREEKGFKFKFIIQVDTLCHRIENFIEKAARAGCNRVFIGLESIDPDALMAAKKRQNKIWEYRKMLQAWKDVGVVTYAGYILGFPGDTIEKIERDIEIIKRELPLDLVEFFFLTPLPGSEDHQKLHNAGVWMDPDMNKYDLNHRVSHHPIMSDQDWEAMYRRAWELYYTPEHIETVLRRGAVRGLKTKNLFLGMGSFYGSITIENIHPLEGGVIRRKVRRQRRHGLSRENPVLFYPRRVWETLNSAYGWARLYLKYSAIHRRVMSDKKLMDYTDIALSPVTDEEELELDLITVHQDAIPNTYGAPKVSAPGANQSAASQIAAE